MPITRSDPEISEGYRPICWSFSDISSCRNGRLLMIAPAKIRECRGGGRVLGKRL